MKKHNICRIVVCLFVVALIFSSYSTKVRGDPPTQAEVFDGRTFSENYWDINVENNSYWDHPDVDDERSWLNNTWNIKWIKEGNFEMGMLAFLNKTTWEDDREVTYTTPAQFWWQHAYKDGKEILIGSMHAAWFGYEDANLNGYYDDDGSEYINPFFYMGVNNKNMTEDVGIISNPKTIVKSLQRSHVGSNITYTWGYNYTDVIFYLPHTSHGGTPDFDWGFNYSDPGTYINGSQVIGNQTYIAYEYTLTIDTTIGTASMHQDYYSGEFGVLKSRTDQVSPWVEKTPGEDGYMPENWSLCLGTWSFIMAGEDPVLEDTLLGEINASSNKQGLKQVQTSIGGVHAFDFEFSQKPTYEISNISSLSVFDEKNVTYECLDVNNDDEFIEFVSGMPQLIGDFGALVLSYAINQTNRFTNGIPFDDIYGNFHPNESAAFFVTCYPEYGSYGGGILKHDPVFVAYFTPESSNENTTIPGYLVEILVFSLSIGIVTIILHRKRINKH